MSLEEPLTRVRQGLALRRALLIHETGEPTDLTRPLLDAIALFHELGIDYALIGGLASMVYGRARHTLDVGFVAVSGHESALGANPEVMRRHHFDPSCTWKLYHASGLDVDICKDEHADAIVARSIPHELAGVAVHVASPPDLIAMKLRADRPQDDYDIAEIARHIPIDAGQIAQLVTPEQFDRYLKIRQRIGLD